MEPETQEKIEKTVLRILQESDMEQTTEHKIRKQAAAELQLDLSDPPYKAFVKQVVQSFLEQQQQQEEEREEEEEEERGDPRKEYDDDGDLIICRLSEKRRVTIQEFRGKTLLSIREYYKKDGKELPTSKARLELWVDESLKKNEVVVVEHGVAGRRVNMCFAYTFMNHYAGISLTEEQWSAFEKNIPAIEKAITKMESRIM